MSAMSVLASIPSPSSGELKIGPLELRAYGLMIALGVVAAVWLFGRRLEEAGAGTREDASSVALWAVPAGVIGSRLYHVATDWDRFSDHPADIVKIWKGGLGIPGGMALGIIVGVWAAWRRHLRPGPVLTAAAPALPLAQAIGRIGNWFNQELFGKPTDLPWALKVDAEHAQQAGYPAGTTFHPTFLYESLWNLALCGLLIWIGKRFRLRTGRLFAFYVLGYGVGRFWVEALRIDPAKEGGGLRLNQWMALLLIAGAGGFLLVDWWRHRNDVPVIDSIDVEEIDADLVDADGDEPDDGELEVEAIDEMEGEPVEAFGDGDGEPPDEPPESDPADPDELPDDPDELPEERPSTPERPDRADALDPAD